MTKPLPSFEWLRDLAEKDPEALERLRQQYIDETISEAPEHMRHRLRGLQFQVDGKIRLSKNPMQSCIAISKMMHDSLHQMKTYIEGAEEGQTESIGAAEPATVLSFNRQQA